MEKKQVMVDDSQLKDAICNNDIIFLEKNLKYYNINHRFEDEDNDTLLLYALSDQLSYAYKFLLEKNADVSLVNNKHENILHAIVYSGDVERLTYILSKVSFNLNLGSSDGTTPLLLSLLLDKKEIFKQLISFGADVNKSDLQGNRPIHVACSEGDILAVIELINEDAELFCKTSKGNYPFALAVNNDRFDIIKYLYPKLYK